MPSFWVRHSTSLPPQWADYTGLVSPGKLLFFQPVLLEARERGQSRVRRVGLTAALFVVQVRAAARAQPPAVAPANHLERQRQQHLLPQHIRQEESFSFKK